MNETRQVPRNGIDSKSLDALLSIDVDSYLTDALEADFIFHDDAPRSRFTRVFSNKPARRALFVATSAAVLLALFFAPYLTRRSDKTPNDAQLASKMENARSNDVAASTSVALDAASDDLALWNYGIRLCDSLTDRAIDSTRNFYRESVQEFSACRLCLAQIADKYSEALTPRKVTSGAQDDMDCGMVNASRRAASKRGLNFDPARIPETLTPSKVDYSMTMGAVDVKDESPANSSANSDMQIMSNDSPLEKIPEKKVDRKNRAKYTLKGSAVLLSSRASSSLQAPSSSQAPLSSSSSVRTEEPGVYTGVELLYVDPFFRVVREIYLYNKEEKERGTF